MVIGSEDHRSENRAATLRRKSARRFLPTLRLCAKTSTASGFVIGSFECRNAHFSPSPSARYQ